VTSAERVKELEAENAHLRQQLKVQAQQLQAQAQRISELEKLVEEVRRGGKRQAAPFSKGEPRTDPKTPGRKAGDKHGRHGHRRVPTAPPERELSAPLPECCPHCGGEITHERDAEQYQTDLDRLQPVTTRFRVAVGRCRKCRRRVQGHHPEQTSDALGAAGAQIGPRAKAWAAWLHYGLGLSFAKCATLLGRLGIDVTAAALCTASQSTGTALVPVEHQILDRLNTSPSVVMDETGWRVGGHSAWLWIATNATVTAYWVATSRGFDDACDLVDDDYDGVIIRDGWGPYRRYTNATHQTCQAHLLRRCHEMLRDLPVWARATPRRVRDILSRALAARDLKPAKRRTVAAELSAEINDLIAEPQAHDACRRLVNHLARESEALFTFLTGDNIDATNWRAEQGIRPAVVNRKVWGGNRTWSGADTQGTIMSVIRTAGQQGVDIIEYLTSHARAPSTTQLLS
jgi:transposase